MGSTPGRHLEITGVNNGKKKKKDQRGCLIQVIKGAATIFQVQLREQIKTEN